jgi:hypothetical protein
MVILFEEFQKDIFSFPWCLSDSCTEGNRKWIKEDVREIISYLMFPGKRVPIQEAKANEKKKLVGNSQCNTLQTVLSSIQSYLSIL